MITIYGELYSKKNSKQIFKSQKTGKAFITSSKKSKESDKDLQTQLREKISEWQKMVGKQEYPLHISFRVFRKTARAFDYINIFQGLLDCMVKEGWLPDDNMHYIIPVFEEWEKDKDIPRCEISITNYNKKKI